MVDVIIDEHISSKRQTFYDFIQLRLDSLKGLLAESMFSTPLDKEIQLHDSRELIQARSVEDLSHITHRIFDEELPLPKENEDDDITNTIYNYIHAHYQNPDLSIPEISNAVGYSVQYISKIFRQNSGITMVDYINKYRINQAIQFLGEGKTVSEIQQLTGFNSNVTFSRNFHKYTGLSPSEYRKIHFH
jgi:YesN/AraC family two-component response regulator